MLGTADLNFVNQVYSNLSGEVIIKSVPYLKNWLVERIDQDAKGIYLLQMEHGMGKSFFCDSLRFDDEINERCTVLIYHINDVFLDDARHFMSIIKKKLGEDFAGYGADYTIKYDGTDKLSDTFTSMINHYHLLLGEDSKLLIVIDGIDEIKLGANSIFSILPKKPTNEKGIYYLYTARTMPELPAEKQQQITQLYTDCIKQIGISDSEYISVIKSYIEDEFQARKIPTDETTINKILTASDNRFLHIPLFIKLLSSKNFVSDSLDYHINAVAFYINHLCNLYTDKFSQQFMDYLCILAIIKEPITIKELTILHNEHSISFLSIGIIRDLQCMIKSVRASGYNKLKISHADIAKYVREKFITRIKDIITSWYENLSYDVELANKSSQISYLFAYGYYHVKEELSADDKINKIIYFPIEKFYREQHLLTTEIDDNYYRHISALNVCQEIIQTNPSIGSNTEWIYAWLGKIYHSIGDYTTAIHYFAKYLASNDNKNSFVDETELQILYGLSLLHSGKSLEAFQKLYLLYKKQSAQLSAEIYCCLTQSIGECNFSAGYLERAKLYYQKCIEKVQAETSPHGLAMDSYFRAFLGLSKIDPAYDLQELNEKYIKNFTTRTSTVLFGLELAEVNQNAQLFSPSLTILHLIKKYFEHSNAKENAINNAAYTYYLSLIGWAYYNTDNKKLSIVYLQKVEDILAQQQDLNLSFHLPIMQKIAAWQLATGSVKKALTMSAEIIRLMQLSYKYKSLEICEAMYFRLQCMIVSSTVQEVKEYANALSDYVDTYVRPLKSENYTNIMMADIYIIKIAIAKYVAFLENGFTNEARKEIEYAKYLLKKYEYNTHHMILQIKKEVAKIKT